MKLSEILEFKKELYFEGAVQADWFYNPDKASMVAENFVFHGKTYFGGESETSGNKKQIDTVSLVEELAGKMKNENSNPLTLAIADYGTGKSHLAVTLGHIFSGKEYMPETYEKIISNISVIDSEAAERIKNLTDDRNFVMIINGMKDFNLHAEILKAAQRSLKLYGLPDDCLKTLNRALQTAETFFERNANNSLAIFEEKAKAKGWMEKGERLIEKIRTDLMTDDTAFEIVNAVYEEINGQEIRWDEGLSANSILEMLISEYCGINGKFDHIVVLFDEFGRYLEYASDASAAKSGDSALQQIFEASQNADGVLQVINFIQSDIKTYLQRVDQTKNISRYIGRYDASDKYYISSNLETVFANLIQRKDKDAFDQEVVKWQSQNEDAWKNIFDDLNRWLVTKGLWKEYRQFRNVIVEGIYPLHPLATFMLTQLSDYLQNRSSLTLISQYIEASGDVDVSNGGFMIMPETLMKGDLYTEMLAAEQEGKQPSQQCIKYDNILKNFRDKLSEKSLTVLRSNLILRVLRFRTSDYEDVKKALALCSGFTISEIEEELNWLENEYAVIGFDEHAGCFDFLEESNGAQDFKILKKRIMANTVISKEVLYEYQIKEIADAIDPIETNYGRNHKIQTNEWTFSQDLYPIESFSEFTLKKYINDWHNATSSEASKGTIIWLYANRDTEAEDIERIKNTAYGIKDMPIVLMLLNDDENRLYDTLKEYYVLKELDDLNRKKYERHYIDAFEQAEKNLTDYFKILKKERLCVTSEGIESISIRLPVYLTNIFEDLYPKSIPFWFDAFLTNKKKLSPKAGGYYCSITKMLISNTVNENNIHNFSSEIRNRIEAVLMTTAATSWKCIDSNYNLIPPEEKNTREIYNDITTEITTNGKLNISDVFRKYLYPPYGLSEEIITLLIAVICGNMSYCLRINYDGQTVPLNSWKDLVIIKDKKIDLDVLRKSEFVVVDTGEINSKYIKLFDSIAKNTNINNVYEYDRLMEKMIQENDIPEELQTNYFLAKQKLDIGKKAFNEFEDYVDEIKGKLETSLDNNDMYPALKGLKKLNEFPLDYIFQGNNYEFDSDSKDTIIGLKDSLTKSVQLGIKPYLSKMICKSVEGINTFKNHNKKVEGMLKELDFFDYAELVRTRREEELSNIEEIRSRQELRANLDKFINDSRIDQYTSYTTLCSNHKYGQALQHSLAKYCLSLGADYNKFKKQLDARVEEILNLKEDIFNTMSSIWDDLFDVNSAEDIDKLIRKIHLVLQKGIEQNDMDEFISLEAALKEVYSDIEGLRTATQSREVFKSNADILIRKYEESELDFDVISILEQIIGEVEKKFDHLEEDWVALNLTLGDKSRSDVYRWKKHIEYLPEYLSESALTKIKALDKEADEILSEGKIEDVLHYFTLLDENEKKKCFEQLKALI